jgi:hypothetical protein
MNKAMALFSPNPMSGTDGKHGFIEDIHAGRACDLHEDQPRFGRPLKVSPASRRTIGRILPSGSVPAAKRCRRRCCRDAFAAEVKDQLVHADGADDRMSPAISSPAREAAPGSVAIRNAVS